MIKITIAEDNDCREHYKAIADFAYWNEQSIEITNDITSGPSWVNVWPTSSGASLALVIETDAGLDAYSKEEAVDELERIFG